MDPLQGLERVTCSDFTDHWVENRLKGNKHRSKETNSEVMSVPGGRSGHGRRGWVAVGVVRSGQILHVLMGFPEVELRGSERAREIGDLLS